MAFAADHALRGASRARPVTNKALLHVKGCLFVRIGKGEWLHRAPPKERANSGRGDVFHGVSQNQFPGRTIIAGAFGQQATLHEALALGLSWGRPEREPDSAAFTNG